VLTLEVPERIAEDRLRPRVPWSRWLAWAATILAFGGLAAGAGIAMYHQQQQKAGARELQRALALTVLDTREAYQESARRLERLARKRPRDLRVATALAEARIFLWGRFDGGEPARAQALAAMAAVRRLGAGTERVEALEGYLLLYQGRIPEAARHAEAALLRHRGSARLGHILGLARFHSGELVAAEATLQLAVEQSGGLLPVRLDLARVERQRGNLAAARRNLDLIQAQSPGHLASEVERVLVLQQEGEDPGEAVLAALARRAGQRATPLARIHLAQARQALRRRDPARAMPLLQTAALARPDDPEIALGLVEAALLPDGDARQAWTLRERLRERTREYPRASALFTSAAAAVGRPDLALRWIKAARADRPERVMTADEQLALIQSARELALPEEADPLCLGILSGAEAAPAVVEACALHAARRRDVALVAKLAQPRSGIDAQVLLGLRHLAHRRYDEAADALRAAAARGPVSAGLLEALAESLLRTGRPRAAVDPLRRAVAVSAQSVRSRLELARALARVGQVDEASRQFNVLVNEQPRGPRTLLDLARLGLVLRRDEDAARVARRVQEAHPRSPVGPYLEGVLLLRAERRLGARERFEAALARDPGHHPSQVELARLAFWRGEVDAGRSLFEEAFRRSGQAPDVIVALGRALLDRGLLDAGREAYQRAALLHRSTGADRRAAEVLTELAERLAALPLYPRDRIRHYLDWALRLSGRVGRAHVQSGQQLQASGKLPEALEAYRRAVAEDPESGDGCYHLGALLVATRGDEAEAVRTLRSFLALEPEGRRADNARLWLQRIVQREAFLRAPPPRR
jgi:tetratricopeptide (TPR) repeat protein